MVGTTREAAVVTESSGDETGDKTGGPGGPGNETGDKTAATGGVMYAKEGSYPIDVRHLCLASIAKFCDGEL